MKRTVKTLAVFTIFLSLTTTSFAQLRLPGIQNGIAPDIRKVVEDYPNHFMNIKGDLIIQNPQSADYECNFKVAGAEKAIVTQYDANKKLISTWEATMLTTEEFDEAKKKFKALYTQLNNLMIQTGDQSSRIKGVYESPVEEKKFTSVIFSCNDGNDGMKKLKVEIVMQYEPMEWKVRVIVYDKEREDYERGSKTDDIE